MKKITMLIAFVLFSVFSHAQFPEQFTNSVPPVDWKIFTGDNNLGGNNNWQRTFNGSSYVAVVAPENVSGGNAQDWLVTPQFTPSGAQSFLLFDQKQEYTSYRGSVYTIRVSTSSQDNIDDFVIVDTQVEGDFSTNFTQHVVDLSAYSGIPIYVAFVMEQNDGDYWFIDNVRMFSRPAAENVFPENFTNSAPPEGWRTYTGTNELGPNNNWQRTFNGSSYVAVVPPENVSGGNAQDWLVSPQFTPNALSNLLKFEQKQEYTSFRGTTYTVRVSTASSDDINDFVIVDTQAEGDFSTNFTEHKVDLSAYNDTPIYVAFVMEQNDGDYWFIDSLELLPPEDYTDPFPQSFESGVPPSGWTSYRGENGLGTAFDWESVADANTGSQAAFVRYENVTGGEAQDWLVTPQFMPTESRYILSFFQKQEFTTDYSTSYRIYVSTESQTNIEDFEYLIDFQTEEDLEFSYTEHTVDLSIFNGTPIYVAFVMQQDDGDNWFIDDVDLVGPASEPNCPQLAFEPINGSTSVPISFDGTIELNWFPPENGPVADGYELFFGTDPSNLFSLGRTGRTSGVLHGLEYNTTYYWQPVPYNSLGSAGGCTVYSFTTETMPAPIVPYFEDNFTPVFANFEPGVGTYGVITQIDHFTSPVTSLVEFAIFANETVGGTANSVSFGFWDIFSRGYLVSSKFDLSADTYYLNFDLALTEYGNTNTTNLGTNNYLALLITEDEGTTWTELARWDNDDAISNTGQAVEEIKLEGYGDDVHFAFFSFSDTAAHYAEVFLDNFIISDTTTSTEDQTLTGVTVYPTIVDTQLNIDSNRPVDQIAIYDLLGKQVFSSQPESMDLDLNLSQLKSGIYIVRIQIENSIGTYKIVKQ